MDPIWTIGDKPRLTVKFTQNGIAADPTAVNLYVQSPSGAQLQTDYSAPAERRMLGLTELGGVTKSSAGVYYYDLLLTIAGTWLVRWEGSGTVAAVAEISITASGSDLVGDSLDSGELF